MLIPRLLFYYSFARDYFESFPLEEDIRRLKEQAHITGFDSVDKSRIDYLLQSTVVSTSENGLSQASNMNGNYNPPQIHNQLREEKVINRNLDFGFEPKSKLVDNFPELSSTVKTNAVGGIGDVELMSLISSVMDLLPDLGEGFIEACLVEFDYNAEKTIDAIFTENLSKNTLALRRDLNRSQYAATIVKPLISAPNVIMQRKNIFDGDEFDIHRRTDIDVSKIHIGKKILNDQVVKKVDNDTKARIKFLEQQQLEEEEAEEERAYIEACNQALAEQDQAAKAVRDKEFDEQDQAERERQEAKNKAKEQERKENAKEKAKKNFQNNKGPSRGRGRGQMKTNVRQFNQHSKGH